MFSEFSLSYPWLVCLVSCYIESLNLFLGEDKRIALFDLICVKYYEVHSFRIRHVNHPNLYIIIIMLKTLKLLNNEGIVCCNQNYSFKLNFRPKTTHVQW